MDMFYAFAAICLRVNTCILSPPTNKFPTEQACSAAAEKLAIPFITAEGREKLVEQGAGQVYKGCVLRAENWDGQTPSDVLKELVAKSQEKGA